MQIGWMSTLADEDDCCSQVQSSGEIGGDCALDETKTGLKVKVLRSKAFTK